MDASEEQIAKVKECKTYSVVFPDLNWLATNGRTYKYGIC